MTDRKAASLLLLLAPFHLDLHAFLHLLRSYIFLMCGHGPRMAEWIHQLSITIAPEHIGRRHRGFAARVPKQTNIN